MRELEFLEAQGKLDAIQNLKFGKKVQIEKLDGVVINEQAMELQKLLDEEEKQFQRLLDEKDRDEQMLLDKLSEERRENTRLVRRLT